MRMRMSMTMRGLDDRLDEDEYEMCMRMRGLDDMEGFNPGFFDPCWGISSVH
jgi:hypothetical protein